MPTPIREDPAYWLTSFLISMLPVYGGEEILETSGHHATLPLGEPKGERDITCYPREEGREGELGGAISVKLPLH